VQYFHWIGHVLQGDFGTSVWTGRPVLGEIAGRVPVTLELTCLSLLVALVFAVPALRTRGVNLARQQEEGGGKLMDDVPHPAHS